MIFAQYFDEDRERAAYVLFVIGVLMELFTDLNDWAFVAILFLGVVTLLGAERYRGIKLGPIDGGESRHEGP